MRKAVPSLILVYLFVSWVTLNAQELGYLPLEPNIVELQGKMLKVMKYGPPNYGENPESDAKYEIPIILLGKPIRIKGDPASVVHKADLTNVSFVQLIYLGTSAKEYWRYTDQNIVVTGTMFRAQTGHHYTPVVMTVKTIRAVSKATR